MYNAEYVDAIKQTLINRCYVELCKQIYRETQVCMTDHTDEYSMILLDAKNDSVLWKTIFDLTDIRPLLRYYSGLLEKMDKTVPPTQMTQTFSCETTFQDYIDQSVAIEVIGAHQYQHFTTSMNDPVFHRNVVKKYEKEIAERTVKNHLVYIVHLHIKTQTGDRFFTPEELNVMGNVINMMPIYSYLSHSQPNESTEIWYELERQVLDRLTA